MNERSHKDAQQKKEWKFQVAYDTEEDKKRDGGQKTTRQRPQRKDKTRKHKKSTSQTTAQPRLLFEDSPLLFDFRPFPSVIREKQKKSKEEGRRWVIVWKNAA